jgi:hypothetical protein
MSSSLPTFNGSGRGVRGPSDSVSNSYTRRVSLLSTPAAFSTSASVTLYKNEGQISAKKAFMGQRSQTYGFDDLWLVQIFYAPPLLSFVGRPLLIARHVFRFMTNVHDIRVRDHTLDAILVLRWHIRRQLWRLQHCHPLSHFPMQPFPFFL